ncbi:hypothetical protein ACFQ51_36170 [Streptomyces kaempferi]
MTTQNRTAPNRQNAPERPLTPKGRATRQRIVAAAAQLMYERGLTEATLEDVRAAAA